MLDSFNQFDMFLANIEIPLTDKEKIGLILSVYSCVISDSIPIYLSEEHLDYAWVSPEEASSLLSYKYPKEFTVKINKLKFHIKI